MERNVTFLKKNIIAHRGLYNNNDIPENSLLSFKKAINKNYIIELTILSMEVLPIKLLPKLLMLI